jgi:hypothetical protein
VTRVVVSPYRVAAFPEGGGHFWVYMQYIQSLRLAGCEVYWIEELSPTGESVADDRAVTTLLDRASGFGLDGKVFLYTSTGPGSRMWIGDTSVRALDVLEHADLLLNFHYAVDPGLISLARRTALVDIDPGLLQLWMRTGMLSVPAHDVYFTTGERVGESAATDSASAIDWVYIRPPVCLEYWPPRSDPSCELFTTVSGWSADTWIEVTEDGRSVLTEDTKRLSFLEIADLPQLTSQPIELALNLSEDDAAERRMLEAKGWRVRHAHEVASTPEGYQAYIQASRGELSVAKPSYVRFQGAWISDRTLCYLASGKPAVVRHTGPSSFLPSGEGLFRFETMAEAADALETVNADYRRHARAARDIVEAWFDGKKVVQRILEVALD